MANKIKLEVVTPEKKVVSVDVDELVAPGANGLFGVRPGHVPFLSVIEPGELFFKTGNQEHWYVIGGGFVEVAEDHVTVLAEAAEECSEIDIDRAKRAKQDAELRLASLKQGQAEHLVQQARLHRATARIRVGGAHH